MLKVSRQHPIDFAARQIAVSAISAYQKYISPRKGFACAHRLLHGGDSCSQYVKRAIAQEGLIEAIAKSSQRFQECKQANQILRQRYYSASNSEPSPEELPEPPAEIPEADPPEVVPEPERNPASSNDCSSGTDCADVSCGCLEIAAESSDACSAADCSAADCSSFDCGSLDCGSLDCGALDCGSCSFFGGRW